MEKKNKKNQTKMKSRSCAAHVNYLLGWLHGLTTQKGMCGDGITGETCTIRKLNGAEKQQIVFSDLMLFISPVYLNMYSAQMWHNSFKCAVSHADRARHGKCVLQMYF